MQSKQISEWCEQTSERTSEWPGTNIPISLNSESLCTAQWIKGLSSQRLKNWAICSSTRSFACTVHSFACSALLTLLAHSFMRSLAHKFAPEHIKKNHCAQYQLFILENLPTDRHFNYGLVIGMNIANEVFCGFTVKFNGDIDTRTRNQ